MIQLMHIKKNKLSFMCIVCYNYSKSLLDRYYVLLFFGKAKALGAHLFDKPSFPTYGGCLVGARSAAVL